MNLKDLNFSTKDVIQVVGFVGIIGSMWYDLKTDQVRINENQKFLQYQIDELKGNKRFAEFILPDKVELKKDSE